MVWHIINNHLSFLFLMFSVFLKTTLTSTLGVPGPFQITTVILLMCLVDRPITIYFMPKYETSLYLHLLVWIESHQCVRLHK